jgi:hypothetical protein
MCMKPAKSKTEMGWEKEREPRKDSEPVPVSENTHPRGNQQADDHDVERGIERLTALVGR